MDRYDKVWASAESKAESTGLGIVEHGWEQHVIIDSKKSVVYRYPKGESGLAKLKDEVFILEELEKLPWDIDIPHLMEFDGKRAKYRLVRGRVLDNEMLNSLSNPQIAEVGYGLGNFLANLHACPKSIVRHKAWVQKGSLFGYYKHHIMSARQENPWKAKALKALDILRGFKPRDDSDVPVHGDLHGLNIVIDKSSKKLVGVIDFSEVETGTRHQDFRKIFTTNERLLRPSLRGYKDACGIRLSADVCKQWAYVNEWANACRFVTQPRNATYRRAMANLEKWQQLN
jgi:aminoglycoside phosphotransferase (APT) family kinase protein